MREKTIEKAVVDYARKRGWLAFKFVSPAQRGVPDRIFFRNGITTMIEFKAPGGKLSKLQQYVLTELDKHNMIVAVIDSIEDGKKFFDLIDKKGVDNDRYTES